MKLRAQAYLRIAAIDWRKKYDSVGDFFEGLAKVRLDRKYGFVDQQGKEVIPLKYDSIGPFFEGLAGFVRNQGCGFIDKQGNEVVPPKYDSVGIFFEGLAPVKLNNKWGFINAQDNVVIPLKYDMVNLNPEYAGWGYGIGLPEVKLNGEWGYTDKKGREIPEEYLTAVMLGGSLDRIKEIERKFK